MRQKKSIEAYGILLLFICSVFVITSCANQSPASGDYIAVGNASEQPKEVTLCGVLGDPAAFNHKLIKIRGVVSRGFEDFTLNDDSCHNRNTMWLELGGLRGSEVIYCCGDNNVDRRREEPLVVEGIETTLIEDEVFSCFERLTKRRRGYGKAQVELVGRYFSGIQQTWPGGTFWMGYGHMGMGSLLVIQQVLSVSKP